MIASMHPSSWGLRRTLAQPVARSARRTTRYSMFAHHSLPAAHLNSVFTHEVKIFTCSSIAPSVFFTESTLSLSTLLTILLTLDSLTTRLYHSTVSLTVLHILGLLHRIILFAKNFHLPRHHHLAPASAFFLGRLRLCVLFIESTSLFIRLITCRPPRPVPVVGLSTVTNLPPPCYLPSIGHRHFSHFPPSLPLLFSVLSRTSVFGFLSQVRLRLWIFFFFCGLAGARPAKGGGRGNGPFGSAGQK